MKVAVTVLGYPIWAEITPLDEGIHVLLAGGVKTHIGGISVAEPDGSGQTIAFPHHREDTVARQWATTLAAGLRCRVAVVCGIHYDNLSPSGLQEVLHTLELIFPRMMEAPPIDDGSQNKKVAQCVERVSQSSSPQARNK